MLRKTWLLKLDESNLSICCVSNVIKENIFNLEPRKCYFLALLRWVIDMHPDHTTRALVTGLSHGPVLVNDYMQNISLANENVIAMHATTSRAQITE